LIPVVKVNVPDETGALKSANLKNSNNSLLDRSILNILFKGYSIVTSVLLKPENTLPPTLTIAPPNCDVRLRVVPY
jgi:hypothetical protein